MFVALLVGVPAIAYAVISQEMRTYQSSVLIQENAQAVDTLLFTGVPAGSRANIQTLGAEARIITTPKVAALAAQHLHPAPADPSSLLSDITAAGDSTTGFITITATSTSPARAANIANAFAQGVVELRTAQATRLLTATIDRLRYQLARLHGPDASVQRTQLSQELQQVVALRAAQGNNAQILQPAVPEATPVSPKTTKIVGLAVLVGFLLAIGAVVIAEATDRRIRNPDDLEELTHLPLLSVIPKTAFSAPVTSSEPFQMLRSALTFFNVDRSLSTILVASPVKGDGKTTVATHLAMTMAHSGRKIVLVDADLRWPQAEARLGITGEAVSPGHGLTGVLTGESALSDALVDVPLDEKDEDDDSARHELDGSLRLLPGGGPVPNPSELLASQRMREVLSQCTRLADVVIIDTTPLLTVSDSIPLLDCVSGAVLVARLNGTPKDAVRRFLKTSSNTGATILGVVATGSAAGGLYGRYGYGYGYGYGYASNGNGNGSRNGHRRLRLAGRRKDERNVKHSP